MKFPFLACMTALLLAFIACIPNPKSNDISPPQNLVRVPLTRQAMDYTCGVAALQSVMAYYGEEIRQDILARELKSSPDSGTNYRNIISFARGRGFTAEIYREMTLDHLKSLMDEGQPVILAIQAWGDDPSAYASGWDDGHYVVAIGYDDKKFCFMDPSTLGNYTYIPVEEFLARWHDMDTDGTRLVNFGIVISRGKATYDPDEIKRLH